MCLDKSQQSQCVSTILTWQSHDWKVSILKISNEIKIFWSQHEGQSRQVEKVGLDTKDNLDLKLDYSRLSRPPSLLFIVSQSSLTPRGQLGTLHILILQCRASVTFPRISFQAWVRLVFPALQVANQCSHFRTSYFTKILFKPRSSKQILTVAPSLRKSLWWYTHSFIRRMKILTKETLSVPNSFESFEKT